MSTISGDCCGEISESRSAPGIEVWEDIKTFLPATFELVFVSISFAILLGILFGVLSAVYRDTWIDHSTRFFSVAGVAVPMFWLGIMLQILLAAKFHLLPNRRKTRHHGNAAGSHHSFFPHRQSADG